MSANILVVEYEPRYVEHVRKALTGPDFGLEIAGNMDEAVNRCANFEPAVVIITSVLPNLKIEDAITQLRARAGLRATPILILMSGYRGENPKEDAVRYGAQDILERPFGADALRGRVEELIRNAPNPAATQAIPQEMLETLRRSAGLAGDDARVTSDDLFGEILSDMEGGEQQPVQAPADVPQQPPAAEGTENSSVDAVLADILETKKAPRRRSTSSTDEEVDKLLSDTLSGLDIAALKDKPVVSEAPAKPADPSVPPRTEQPTPPAARVEPSESAPPAKEPPEEKAEPAASPVERPSTPPTEEPPVEKGQAPRSERPAPSGTEFGQYVIEEHIATGGMADVYKARMMGMEGFQKTVAIKRILSNLTDSDEFVRMFIDEAKLAAQLNHNNIIHIYDLGKVDRSHYIAMEYIEGRDLRSILEKCRERDVKMPIELALYTTNLLASALDYAHKKRDFDNRALGLVHRDVSPQNVLISFDGDVKLCDFGIAKAASKATQTRAGALKGKLQYMSPEQAWGKDIDHRSDLFSLGLVLFEMLTNEKVFSGTSELSVLEQVRDPIITAPSMKNPDVDSEVDRIIFLALNAEREERYQSADDMKRDLERIVRKKGWSADRSTLVAFLEGLDSDDRVTPASVDVEKTPETTEPPPAPPPPMPPVGPALESSPEPPPSEEPDDLLAADEDLEKVLSTPLPSVKSARLEVDDSGFRLKSTAAGGEKKRLWMLLGALALVLVGAGGWFIFGRKGSESPATARAVPIAVVVAETPTPEPTVGLMSEQELIERAREVAAAEITKQEEELRKRLEEEFPTPTPFPPTPTPSDTPTPLPTDTPTPVPPTPTLRPPTATPIPPTPTPSVREGDIVVPGPGVNPPVMIYREPPAYPPAAERMGASGVVAAEALIGIDGTVEEVRIIRVEGRNFGFEKATEEAIFKWRYKPASKKGVKVRVWVTIRVPFRLQ
jgi:TonB family protein